MENIKALFITALNITNLLIR